MAQTIVAKCPWCHGSGRHPCLKEQPCTHLFGGAEREMDEAELPAILREGAWREKMWAHAAVVAMAQANRDVSHLLAAVIETCSDRDFCARGTAVRAAGVLVAYCHPMAAQLEAAVLAAYDDSYFGVRACAVATDLTIQIGKGTGAVADSHVARVLSACGDLDVDVRCAGAASAARLREMGCGSEDLESIVGIGLSDSSKTARAAFKVAWVAFEATGAKKPEPVPVEEGRLALMPGSGLEAASTATATGFAFNANCWLPKHQQELVA